MKDQIVTATAAGSTVRVFAADTTNMVKSAWETHGLSPVATAALGRTITATAIMSKMLKGEQDTITVQIKGDGPIGGIVAVSDHQANVRGYVHNPETALPLNNVGKLDVSGAVGKKGYMNVIRDMGLKEPYIGYVELVSGEIAEDIAYYFAASEQIPTVVSLGVLIDTDGSVLNAGGFIIQLMPGADEKIINYIENTIASIPCVTYLLASGENPCGILDIIFGEKDLKIIDIRDCKYQCNCSRERMENNIICLGKSEIQSIIDDQHEAEIQCHFCNKKYYFSEKELSILIT